MLVNIVIDFKDGHTQYYAGERVWMEDVDAEKFVGYGWAAADLPATPVPTNTTFTLNIKDGQIGQHAEH